MPLDTSSKRRSSVGLLSPWQVAPPSPTDSPGEIDVADREQIAWAYSGIGAAPALPTPSLIVGISARLTTASGQRDGLRQGSGLIPWLVAESRGVMPLLRG